MIHKIIKILAEKNLDELTLEIKNEVKTEEDFNNYVKVLNKPKPDYLTWENIKKEEKIFNAINNRVNEYGSIAEQIEYITENGLDAWQSKVNSIKAKYPKN